MSIRQTDGLFTDEDVRSTFSILTIEEDFISFLSLYDIKVITHIHMMTMPITQCIIPIIITYLFHDGKYTTM